MPITKTNSYLTPGLREGYCLILNTHNSNAKKICLDLLGCIDPHSTELNIGNCYQTIRQYIRKHFHMARKENL